RQVELLGELDRRQVQATDQFGIGFGDVVVRRNDLARDDQNVRRRLRVGVPKGEAVLVFVDDLGGNLSFDDLQENVVGHHGGCPSSVVQGRSKKNILTKTATDRY